MVKKLLLIMLALFLILLSACTAKEPAEGDEPAAGDEPGEASEPGEETDAGFKTVVEGKFIVGFDQNFPPMGFVGEDGEFTGFDLELAAEVARRLGLELVLQPIAWDSKDMELSSGNIDCIWNGFTINGREDKYTWTDPYMANNQVFVVRADSDISSLADLAGKVVSVQIESSAEAALNDRPDLVETSDELITDPD